MAGKTKDRIRLTTGDITDMGTDAIVNAANNDLQLGGGVAGAIARRAGPAVQQECDRIGPIAVGEAAVTGGGRLKARYVIHAASMSLGRPTAEKALRSSVAHSLRLADEKGLRSIAFPAVGAGIAGFPIRRCAEVMLEEALAHLERGSGLEEVWFVLFDPASAQVFQDVFDRL